MWHGGWWPDAYAGLLLKAPDDGWTLIALGNTDGIHWGNPLHKAEVEKALAAKFLNLFVADQNTGPAIANSAATPGRRR